MGSLSLGPGLAKVKEFSMLWRRSAAASLSLAGCLVLIGVLVPNRIIFFSMAAGILPGIVDLVGLGLRLPLWAKLNQRAALTSINLRLFSRLILLGVFFYVIQHYTTLSVGWSLLGIFVPYAIYLIWAIFRSRHKGVN